MKITNVKLTNVNQHREVDIDIHDNIVGIVGQNGSGKSNFASSISIAVTGEFGKKKKDLITYGEKTGGIEVSGIIKSKPFTINRQLHNNDAWLKYEGDEDVNGADAVTERVLSLLGCDKSFLPNMVFVTQQDILGLLFGRASERNKMLQKFFGLEKAAKLEQLIGRWKSNISYPAIIDEAQATAAIESLNKMIYGFRESEEKLVSKYNGLCEKMDSIDQDKIQENLVQARRKAKIELDVFDTEGIVTESEELLGELKAPEFTEEDIEALRKKQSKMNEEAGGLRELIEILSVASNSHASKDDGCSICGGELSPTIIESMSRRLEESQKSLAKIDRQYPSVVEEIAQKTKELKKYTSRKEELERLIKSGKNSIASMQKELNTTEWPKHPPERYQAGLDEIRDNLSEISSLDREIKTTQKSISGLRDQIKQHETDLESAKLVKSEFSGTKIHESRVSRIRDVFRHDGVSGLYVNSKMNQMSESINQYLQSFGAQYRVSVDKDHEFICDFGHKKAPASDLSCGQKVTLSLAFRFAACEIFSTGVDLIVLDEPTTWLDRETILKFKDVIENISSLSDSQNLQVLTITHERSLVPYFRQVIEL